MRAGKTVFYFYFISSEVARMNSKRLAEIRFKEMVIEKGIKDMD